MTVFARLSWHLRRHFPLAVCLLTLATQSSVQAQSDDDDFMLTVLSAILSGVKTLPVPIDFKVQLPTHMPVKSYTVELTRWNLSLIHI